MSSKEWLIAITSPILIVGATLFWILTIGLVGFYFVWLCIERPVQKWWELSSWERKIKGEEAIYLLSENKQERELTEQVLERRQNGLFRRR